jgi:hypothetical protein
MNQPARVKLGSWRCPSGNGVDVSIEPDTGPGTRQLTLAWDTPPPLTPTDEAYYLAVIQPAVARLVSEYTERTGRILVIMP